MRSGWRVRGPADEADRVARGRAVEGQDGDVSHSLGRGGGHQRGAATEAGEPDDGVGPAELERHGAVDPGPGESRVDLEAESRLAAHLDDQPAAASSSSGTPVRPAREYQRATTATSGS